MKRILTIQDISCVGKCSITVALPVISAAGVETAILPTAVLSTHTAFHEFTCTDLEDQIDPISDLWIREGIDFSCIYTGYLSSPRQIGLVKGVFEKFRKDGTLIIADPAMADGGRMYQGFSPDFAPHMASLCAQADIILPNLTEASFMTGMPYRETCEETYIREMLRQLAGLGAGIVVITGVSLSPGRTGAYGYDSTADEYYCYQNKRIDALYHGTGDVFSSAFVGALMNGFSWKEAIPIAADYTARSIQATLDDPHGVWYGVHFEQALPYYLERLGKI